MQVYFKPKTKLGKWSAWLIVAFAVLLGAFQAIWGSQLVGDTLLERFFKIWVYSPAPPLGIAASITGLISILSKRKERSIAVYLAIIFGLIGPVIWIVGMIMWLSSVNQ